MAERKTLTERQKEFCRLCAAGTEPKEAAKQMGYASRGMWKKLMGMEKIQKEIQRWKEQTAAQAEKTMPKAEGEAAVAEKEEILCFLTEMMREDDDPKLRMKAAELLGKRESLFEKGKKTEEKSPIIIVDDLP
ncbi:MAG: hypothetical protein ACI4TP_05865 [Anaerotignum sp.]